jgi:hypothetical protein
MKKGEIAIGSCSLAVFTDLAMLDLTFLLLTDRAFAHRMCYFANSLIR